MATTYLNKTLGTPTNNKIWTFSAWVKRTELGGYGVLLNAGSSRDCIRFRGDNDCFQFFTGEDNHKLITNRVFRDVSGYYHIVVAVDTTQVTDTNRVKIYVNGVQETSFSNNDYPSENQVNLINSAIEHRIGKASNAYDEYFGGLMSHIHFIDGTQYAASAFGSTDATSGEWEINTSPSVTYGDNGFFILKNGNSVTDQSGEGNNWTVAAGTLTDLQDCPDDVFATGNPLDNYFNQCTYTNGNTTWTTNSGTHSSGISTLAVDSGKWYVEGKLTTNDGNIGITDRSQASTSAELGQDAYSLVYQYGGTYRKDGSSGAYGNSYTAGDIIGIALDLDNNKIYFSKNGTWQNSGVPTSGATGTGAISVTDPASTNSGVYHIAAGDWNDSASIVWGMNFGNGYFGTTAISSEGTNASGIGKFEYDVPTGYTALSTKGLNE